MALIGYADAQLYRHHRIWERQGGGHRGINDKHVNILRLDLNARAAFNRDKEHALVLSVVSPQIDASCLLEDPSSSTLSPLLFTVPDADVKIERLQGAHRTAAMLANVAGAIADHDLVLKQLERTTNQGERTKLECMEARIRVWLNCNATWRVALIDFGQSSLRPLAQTRRSTSFSSPPHTGPSGST